MDKEEINDNNNKDIDKITYLSGMYKEWFLDYASYVILERAVPALEDGLKPVQRRILHSLKELDDGRYNKVANIIGNTMKYHPHGDASIGDALVQIGQKDLILDCQGNWGNILTGDGAAAPRYIEVRVNKFGNHILFNPKTTSWLTSYDGRNKEPEYLPVKFPLLLSQGAEGIAVGLSCKFLPHNFIELVDASINHLRGKKVEIFPDFAIGGMADFTQYNDGLRGGKVRVRAIIEKVDNKTLKIDQIPYSTTTDSLIDSIVKANDKGKIKIKKIEDNTAEFAEIIIKLASGVSPDKMIDALYAFTNCELSISPNSCVIENNKPVFLGVSELLRRSTDRTVSLLQQELDIRLCELEDLWHWLSLERIFIDNKVYRDIEKETSWEGVLLAIEKGLKPHIKHLKRKINPEDIIKLTEIKIKKISKFDKSKSDENIARVEDQIKEVKNNLDNLISYAIDYFKDIKDRFSEGKERKTEIRVFDSIVAKKVIVSNKKLYINRQEGFIGWGLRKDEFISECSEIDDIIIFLASGKLVVTKVADKKFIGKDIIHVAVWKKGDSRTIYHLIYQAGKQAPTFMKRFAVNSITRDKEYSITAGVQDPKIHYFSVNPNGRKEIVSVKLRARPKLKKIRFDIDFSELLIKGRNSKGNRVTKHIVSKIEQKEVGGSTLAAREIWWDSVVRRLNNDGRGISLGKFKGDDKILTIYDDGSYLLTGFELSTKFKDNLISIEKFYSNRPISCVYYNGKKDICYVKRFLVENIQKNVLFISDDDKSELLVATTTYKPKINIEFNKRLKETKHLKNKIESLDEIVEVKGVKAQGNQLTKLKVKSVNLLLNNEDWPEEIAEDIDSNTENINDNKNDMILNINNDNPVELELTIDNKTNDSSSKKKPDNNEDTQMSLF